MTRQEKYKRYLLQIQVTFIGVSWYFFFIFILFFSLSLFTERSSLYERIKWMKAEFSICWLWLFDEVSNLPRDKLTAILMDISYDTPKDKIWNQSMSSNQSFASLILVSPVAAGHHDGFLPHFFSRSCSIYILLLLRRIKNLGIRDPLTSCSWRHIPHPGPPSHIPLPHHISPTNPCTVCKYTC